MGNTTSKSKPIETPDLPSQLSFINSVQIQYATDVFNKFDTSNDGKIQLTEAIQGFKSMKITFDENTLRKIIFLVDSDFDGELDLKEFIRLFIIAEISKKDIKVQQELMLFLAADLNFNGKIDKQEYQIICQKCGYPVNFDCFQGKNEIGVDLFIQQLKQLKNL
ncbi:hypothetical protein SS50377_20885 [Spironucleus salmonicida]|uniref:EF-hand domain-containing protein n=1 Tax=Spironucleus salmonicida TaxID=348837 RepID=V6LIL8_9EUKA|nr:hypothetical protein SS50377_20885 [Spironucleus salmonicida]|eukprot:EST43561.1 hypothetical protein SS50377_16600 [Spironucleus salmonicida]